MRVYIMTDLEGVAGVLNFEDWCTPAARYYAQACLLLTEEVNAAVAGFLAAGATDVLVADGHGHGAMVPDRLHPAAELARNWPAGNAYPFSMDKRSFDVAAWIGQHPKAGTVGGHLCHTGSFSVRDMSVNGVSVGEFGECALCAGELGIRCILACGCEAFTREAQALVPGIETVAVKQGVQTDPGHTLPAEAYGAHNTAGIHLVPQRARERIRAGAENALRRARTESFGLLRLAPPYTARMVLRSDARNPARLGRREHARSVIELLNAPCRFEPLPMDPLVTAESAAK